VNNLIRIASAPTTDEERKKVCNDAENPRVARLVRFFLCKDIATIIMDGFKSERLFVSYHIWDWMLSYVDKRVVAASSITVLGMQKALSTVAALGYDKSASFRAFVCVALSSGMLDTWFSLLVSDEEKMNKFFAPNALLRKDADVKLVLAQFARLSKIPFSLSTDFEVRESKSEPPK